MAQVSTTQGTQWVGSCAHSICLCVPLCLWDCLGPLNPLHLQNPCVSLASASSNSNEQESKNVWKKKCIYTEHAQTRFSPSLKQCVLMATRHLQWGRFCEPAKDVRVQAVYKYYAIVYKGFHLRVSVGSLGLISHER